MDRIRAASNTEPTVQNKVMGLLESGRHGEARDLAKTLPDKELEVLQGYVQQRYGFKL